jgi:hypothetical protein
MISFTLCMSKTCSPGPARLAPGVRVFSAMAFLSPLR